MQNKSKENATIENTGRTFRLVTFLTEEDKDKLKKLSSQTGLAMSVIAMRLIKKALDQKDFSL